MRARALLAAPVALFAAGCPATCGGQDSEANQHPMAEVDTSFTLFATTELRGQLEPCGCSTEPHGDIARSAQIVDRAHREENAIFVDGGSTIYSSPSLADDRAVQERKRAEFIAELFDSDLRAAAVGLGPYDLSEGPERVAPARAAANLRGAPNLELAEPGLVEAGEHRVGLFGVVSEGALAEAEPEGGLDLEIDDPAEVAAERARELREDGADVVIALAHMTGSEAEALAGEAPAVDFVLVGQDAPEPEGVDGPRRVGDTWLFQPANRGQVISRLDVSVSGEGRFEDALGPDRAEERAGQIEEQMETLSADLEEWRADPDADPEFVEGREDDLAELERELEELEDEPLRAPETGNWFTLSQIPITEERDCHEEVQARKLDLDEAIGKANLEHLEDREPEPAPEGEPHYVGGEACAACHVEEAEFWDDTAHAAAWETLEDYGKQYDLDCVSCHVTGYERPGGSNLAHNEGLRDVQCEVCHGPGSLHVEAGGDEDTPTVARTPPESLCVDCHNEEHSDTFEYEAYLRDITGPGHGASFREELGDGPTGGELRSEALAEADEGRGENCLK